MVSIACIQYMLCTYIYIWHLISFIFARLYHNATFWWRTQLYREEKSTIIKKYCKDATFQLFRGHPYAVAFCSHQRSDTLNHLSIPSISGLPCQLYLVACVCRWGERKATPVLTPCLTQGKTATAAHIITTLASFTPCQLCISLKLLLDYSGAGFSLGKNSAFLLVNRSVLSEFSYIFLCHTMKGVFEYCVHFGLFWHTANNEHIHHLHTLVNLMGEIHLTFAQ